MEDTNRRRLRLPIGNDIFAKIRQSGDYYVDKTRFIEALLNEPFEVNLITRPRRFGKTLTMSMLDHFFDIRQDSQKDFEGLAIGENEKLCGAWLNQWPTIFLTLKSISGSNFESAYEMLQVLAADVCKKYAFLENSHKVDADDKEIFRKLKARQADDGSLKNFLYLLTRMMHAHCGKPVILLIDEYDVPLAKASDFGYYAQMLEVVRALFDKAFKSNEFLKFAVITGCLMGAKESIFTGTNNFVMDTITSGRFDEYIGFTAADVQTLLKDAGLEDHAKEVKHWYDGYRFGSVDVYCPWDVLNHVAALQTNPNARPQSYWENTSHNNIIRKFIERTDLWGEEHINEDFETLLGGGHIVKHITEHLTYDMLHSSAENLWSLLYMTGYLTQVPGEEEYGETVTLRIPNEEIRRLFQTTVAEWFKDKVKSADRSVLFNALWEQDEQKCSLILSDLLFDTISYNDYKENYYHAFVTGILSFAGYKVRSNAEAGEGRPDVLLCDERRGRAIVIEIKHVDAFEKMNAACQKALEQIEDRHYAEGLGAEYEEILCYGMSFYKKRCRVRAKRYR